MVLEAKPLGAHATPNEAAEWLRTGEPPRSITDALLGEELASHLRHVERLRFLLDPALDVVRAAQIGMVSEEDVAQWILRAKTTLVYLLADGYDTNWGSQDLRSHCAIVCDMSRAEVAEMLAYPAVRFAHPLAPREVIVGKRRSRRLAYERRLHDDTLAAARSPMVLVVPPRDATPATFAGHARDVG